MSNGVRVWPLDWKTKCSTPDLGRGDTKCSRHTEEDSVVFMLRQTIMHKEGTRAGINVWPWVLNLANLAELNWNDLVVGLDKVY